MAEDALEALAQAAQAQAVDLPQPQPLAAAIEADKAKVETAKPAGPVNLTYVPGPEDPPETVWNGVRFRANVPTPVDAAALARSPLMIEQAKGNPHFEVEGYVKPAPKPRFAMPKTSEEYRAHAVKWFPQARTLREFDARWEAEAPMREKCGVGHDDLMWLASLGDPLRSELQKAADEPSAHLA